jgi:hypothetical protein
LSARARGRALTALCVGASRTQPPLEVFDRTSLDVIAAKDAERKRASHAATAGKYAAGAGEFKLHVTRSNLEAVREEVTRERDKELRVPAFKAKPVPEYPEEVYVCVACVFVCVCVCVCVCACVRPFPCLSVIFCW